MNRLLIPLLLLPLAVVLRAAEPREDQPTGTAAGASWIPALLQPWEAWVLRPDDFRRSPVAWDQPAQRLPFWISTLAVQADGPGGTFTQDVQVYDPAWVPLPGGEKNWPGEVRAGTEPLPVLSREGRPVVKLPPGRHSITGTLPWTSLPPSLAVPHEAGVLRLTVEGEAVSFPRRDEDGVLWLQAGEVGTGQAEDRLGVRVSALLEDGVPLWLRLEIELTASGRSREVTLGQVLPAGWKAGSLESPLPAALDASGELRVQVRPGRWTLRLGAFRVDDARDLAFAAGVRPVSESMLLALRDDPALRVVELEGAPVVDASQAAFPEAWRGLPVYRWDTAQPLRIVERLRGPGRREAGGLNISRRLWLEADGSGWTFEDRISGARQEIWRLDAAAGTEPGAVRAGAENLLLTKNPATGAAGVEVRQRDLELVATGRQAFAGPMKAAGWQADAASLQATLQLPPGWRLFTLLGADWVQGDMVTAWSLLDLFLLLVFALAVLRLCGLPAALLALLVFALTTHEPDAPRYLWLALLAPLALLKVVSAGRGQRWVRGLFWLAALALVAALVPFVSSQIQQAVYPQLEALPPQMEPLQTAASAPSAEARTRAVGAMAMPMSAALPEESVADKEMMVMETGDGADNLQADPQARVQTGPGVPDWTWREVAFGWNGPVQAGQEVRLWLIPAAVERGLSVLRVVACVLLAAWLFSAGRSAGSRMAAVAATLLAMAIFLGGGVEARAQFPPRPMLEELRERLLAPPDPGVQAAEIPHASLTLREGRVLVEAEIHTARLVAVPVPGRLAGWSPVQALVDGSPAAVLRREDGFLWVALPPGVHRVRVEGLLPAGDTWEWSFRLRPHRVTVQAEGWTVAGVGPEGIPGDTVFLSRQDSEAPGTEPGDRTVLVPLVAVERRLELGLVWKVQTTVRRLAAAGRGVSLRLPLLPGESVLTPGVMVQDGLAEVGLGPADEAVSWESSLAVSPRLELATRATDTWVERWSAVVSPVWNLVPSGPAPFYEPGAEELVPVWQPWPGETVALKVTRPEPLPGPTFTVQDVLLQTSLGRRQRTSELRLTVLSSLGQDFTVQLPEGAGVTGCAIDGNPRPVRQQDGLLTLPLVPGRQVLEVAWSRDEPLAPTAAVDPVRLAGPAANVTLQLGVPAGDRWVLWARGPQQGPAVRFWLVLAASLLAALLLGRVPCSPLRTWEWMLLAVGLTQVPPVAAAVVVVWLFALVWRGRLDPSGWRRGLFNTMQLLLILLTAAALTAFVAVGAAGLLGDPAMFILGGDSSPGMLRWYEAATGADLPGAGILSVSIWWYRLLMLLWALWLAAALVRWLGWGWGQFSHGGCFRGRVGAGAPPLPPAAG